MGYVSQNRLFVSQHISVYQNQLGTEQLAYIFYDIHYTLVYSFNQSLLIFFPFLFFAFLYLRCL